MEKCLVRNLLIDCSILHTIIMPQINFDPKIITAVILLGVVVLLAVFGEFLLPLAIILIPVVIIFGISQLKKQTNPENK